MKPKSLKTYENQLTQMVSERKGKLDSFLLPQLKITAQCWRMLDKIDEELNKSDLVTMELGSMGQMKSTMNPLLAQYDKTSRTLRQHLSALGLNYDAMPTKVNDTDAPGAKSDPLNEYMETLK